MPQPTDTIVSHAETGADNKSAPVRIRYRIRFAKTGLLKWISHRDLARLWERLLRRAELKLSMTEGFHPKPRISFPSALALGVESYDEVVEIELAESWDADALAARLRDDRQPGLEIRRVDQVPDGFGKAQLRCSHYTISIPPGSDVASVDEAIAVLTGQPVVTLERKGKTVKFDVASQIDTLRRAGGELVLTLVACDTATLRPNDILLLLGFTDWIEQGATIIRTGVELTRELERQDQQ